MFKNKLVFKIAFGYTLITLISLLLVGLFFINLFKEYTFQNKEDNMTNRAKEIARVSGQYITDNKNFITEYKGFLELLDSFANSRLWITDKNGSIIVTSKGELCNGLEQNNIKNITRDNSVIQKVLSGQEISLIGQGLFYNESMVTVGVPIYNPENKIVGTVFLHSPIIGITGTVDKAFQYLIIGISFAILLSALMGGFYSSLVAKPLKLMNNAAMEMAKGNYGIQTEIHQKDEIGQLSKSLDLLSSKLGFTIDQLFQEKGKLNDLISSISEGILAFDSNMTLINHNQSLLKLFDYKPETEIAQLLKEDLQKHNILEEFNNVITTSDNKSFLCEWNFRKLKFILSPVISNTGEITGVVALIQDVSESERLEQMRKDFVANVSHELRTPLTLIKGSVETLIDEVITEPDEVKKYHRRILTETNGLERLVNDLMDLGRLQSGKFSLNFENIEMKSLVIDTINRFKSIAQNKRIEIVFESPEHIPQIRGDYDRLRQLLIIFLDNAIKYSNENTKIHILMEVTEHVYLKIKDNGIGIPNEDLPFVLERFYKVDKARSNPQLGTGLGLAIAKYLIEAHHGIVWLESELNIGTTVIFGLPYIKE